MQKTLGKCKFYIAELFHAGLDYAFTILYSRDKITQLFKSN